MRMRSCLFTVILIATVRADVEVNLNDFKELTSLAEPSERGLENLSALGEKATILFKYLSPAGWTLAMNGTQIGFKWKPSEVALIQTEMVDNFQKSADKLSRLMSTITVPRTASQRDYEEISLDLSLMTPIVISTLKNESTSYSAAFINNCRPAGRSSPEAKLYHLRSMLTSCPDATVTNTPIFAEYFVEIGRIERWLGRSSPKDFIEYRRLTELTAEKEELSMRLSTADGAERNLIKFRNKLDEIEAADGAIRDAGAYLVDHLSVGDADAFGCLPNAIANSNQLRRSALNIFANRVAIDILRTLQICHLCIVLNEPSQHAQVSILRGLVLVVDQLGEKFRRWIYKKIRFAWPRAITAYAKLVVQDSLPINPEDYGKVAEKIRTDADSRSTVDHNSTTSHYVLVTDSWQGDDRFHFHCGDEPEPSCAAVLNRNGINFVISRRVTNVNGSSLADNAKIWIDSNEKAVIEFIRTNQYILPLSRLSSLFRKTFDSQPFRGLVLTRKSFWTADATVIRDGISKARGDVGIFSIEVFCPHHLPDFSNHVRFKLYCFL